MYYIYGQSGPSLLIESTDSMISSLIMRCMHNILDYVNSYHKAYSGHGRHFRCDVLLHEDHSDIACHCHTNMEINQDCMYYTILFIKNKPL